MQSLLTFLVVDGNGPLELDIKTQVCFFTLIIMYTSIISLTSDDSDLCISHCCPSHSLWFTVDIITCYRYCLCLLEFMCSREMDGIQALKNAGWIGLGWRVAALSITQLYNHCSVQTTATVAVRMKMNYLRITDDFYIFIYVVYTH